MIDKDLGIDTEGYMKINNIMGYAEYDATPYPVLQKMIEYYPFQKNDCFIDFGCGKGRVVCFAAANGCENIIGVELNEKIFEILSQNVKHTEYRDKIRIFNQKAERYIVDPCINKCFFYNPFYLKYFIKIYNNVLNMSHRKSIQFFLCDAAEEYQLFLSKQNNVVIENQISCGDGMPTLFVYKICKE